MRDTTTKTLRQLESERGKINSEIERRETIARKERARSLIGKCYRYHNSGDGTGKRWWLYLKVLGVTQNGMLKTVQFEVYSNGECNAKQYDWHYPHSVGEGTGYSPITDAVFASGWKEFVARVNQIGKLAAQPHTEGGVGE